MKKLKIFIKFIKLCLFDSSKSESIIKYINLWIELKFESDSYKSYDDFTKDKLNYLKLSTDNYLSGNKSEINKISENLRRYINVFK